jgi:hypothetical protein
MRRNKIAEAVAGILGGYLERVGLALGALSISIEKADHAKLPDAVKALYVERDGKFALDVEGVEDTAGLKSALEKERKTAREETRLRKEFEKRFEGIDPDEVRKMMEKLGGDEEASLIKAGKIDEVVARRMEKSAKAAEKAVKDADARAAKKDEENAKLKQRALDERVRAAATKAGLHANAVDDALFRARTIFTFNGDEVVQLDTDGHPVMGKDGKTPFGPVEWLEGMKDTAPHWFPAGASGSGAAGGTKGGGSKTMKRSAFDALGAMERAQVVKDKVTIVD